MANFDINMNEAISTEATITGTTPEGRQALGKLFGFACGDIPPVSVNVLKSALPDLAERLLATLH